MDINQSLMERTVVTDNRRIDIRGAREERLFVQVKSCESEPELENTTISCSTMDVSASGMRLSVVENLALDAKLELWIEIKGCPGKFLLHGLVKWCRPHSGEFICGIELVDDGEVSDMGDWQDLFI